MSAVDKQINYTGLWEKPVDQNFGQVLWSSFWSHLEIFYFLVWFKNWRFFVYSLVCPLWLYSQYLDSHSEERLVLGCDIDLHGGCHRWSRRRLLLRSTWSYSLERFQESPCKSFFCFNFAPCLIDFWVRIMVLLMLWYSLFFLIDVGCWRTNWLHKGLRDAGWWSLWTSFMVATLIS